MTDIFVRTMDITEAEQVSNLFKTIVSNLDYYNDVARTSEISKYSGSQLVSKINEEKNSVLVAVHDKTIVGFCFGRHDDGLLWMEWFGVAELYRKSGVGRALLSNLEKNAFQSGIHKVWCDCRTVNHKSIKLLSSSGYLPISTVINHWYGQDFILWQKFIGE